MQVIQEVNILLLHRGMSIDRSVDKLHQDLNKLGDIWIFLLQEAKHVTNAMMIETSLVRLRDRLTRSTRNI